MVESEDEAARRARHANCNSHSHGRSPRLASMLLWKELTLQPEQKAGSERRVGVKLFPPSLVLRAITLAKAALAAHVASDYWLSNSTGDVLAVRVLPHLMLSSHLQISRDGDIWGLGVGVLALAGIQAALDGVKSTQSWS